MQIIKSSAEPAAPLVCMELHSDFQLIGFLSHSLILREKAVKASEVELLSSKQQTDSVRVELQNKEELSAAKEQKFPQEETKRRADRRLWVKYSKC